MTTTAKTGIRAVMLTLMTLLMLVMGCRGTGGLTVADSSIEAAIRKHVKSKLGSVKRIPLTGTDVMLYWAAISNVNNISDWDRGIGLVSRDGKHFLEKEEGLKELVAEPGVSPTELAIATMALLQNGGVPLSGPDSSDLIVKADAGDMTVNGAEKVTAPAVDKDVLTFWSYYTLTAQPSLQRTQLDLRTLEVTEQGPDFDVHPVDRALAAVAMTNSDSQRGGVEDLGRLAPTEPRAHEALVQILATHADAKTRSAAADALSKCPGSSTVAALLAAARDDSSDDVRSFAIYSLQRLGDPSARAPLEALARETTNDGVQRALQRALKALPKAIP